MNYEDLTLTELQKKNVERIQSLATQGVGVGNLEYLYLCRLLEHLVGDAIEKIQYEHELMVANQLDNVESEVRKASILNGGVPQNGKLK